MTERADLVVVGTGWAGLVAALTGHDHGLTVTLLERSALVGGTSAISSGGTWVPANRWQAEAGIEDDESAALEYLSATSALAHVPEVDAVMRAYIANINKVVSYLESATPLRFEPLLRFADYRYSLPGSRFGRTLVPAPFDLGRLGSSSALVRLPREGRPSLTDIDVAGGYGRPGQAEPDESGAATAETVVRGAAGTAALLSACLDRGIVPRTGHRVVELIGSHDAVEGVRAAGPDDLERTIVAGAGVVLATGGCDWDPWNNRLNVIRPFTGAATVAENDGDGHRMATRLGLPLVLMDQSHWTVAFELAAPDGSAEYRPCTRERSSPHSIIVNRHGCRFVNEASPYNDFVSGSVHRWDAVAYEYPNWPMYLIFDEQHRRRYAVAGSSPDDPLPPQFIRASSLDDLAAELGVPAGALRRTVDRFNADAAHGIDCDLHRGDEPYERFNGDNAHAPNPCLGTVEQAPFYGVPLHVSTLGHKGGLVTDGFGRAIDRDGHAVRGLYAVGNVAAALHHGLGYTGGGILGRSLVFGHLAARHAAGRIG